MPLGLPPSPTIGDQHPPLPAAPIWEYDGAKWVAIAGPASLQTKTLVVGSGLPTSGTINIDLDVLNSTVQTVALTGGATFTTSNRAAGRHLELVLVAGASARTLAWPAGWQAFGAALPTSLASGAVLRLAIECLGTADTDIDATSILNV